jgi:hypothetical protein
MRWGLKGALKRDGSSKDCLKIDRIRRGTRVGKAHSIEGRVRKCTTWEIEGSKAHSKRDRVRKSTTHEVRARRRTQKEAGLENALPKVVEGSKVHSKGGRVRKRTTQGVEGSKAHSKGGRVVRCTSWDVWWLEGTLKEMEDRARSTLSTWWGLNSPLKKVTMRHWSIRDESNASWSICMYTYLRNIGPLFFMEFSFFSKVWVSDSKLWWLFSLLLTRVISCDLDP